MTGPVTGRTSGAQARGRVGWSGAATLVTGLLGWVTTVAVARMAGPADFAGFAVLWGLFFGVGGAFAGLQQEVTRTVGVTERTAVAGPSRLLPRLVVLAVPGAALAAAAVAAGRVAGLRPTAGAVCALAVGLVGLAVLTILSGVLAARGRWASLAALLVADAAVRTGAVLGVVVAERGDLLPWAVVSGALVWVPLLVVPSLRSATTARGADRWPGLLARSATAMGATTCAALLVSGFPLLLSITREPGEVSAVAGVLLATLVLVRAPLLVVVFGFRPALLHAFLTDQPAAAHHALRWWMRLAGPGALAVVLAALVGPALVRVVFGAQYATGRLELVALTAGSVQLAMLVVSGLALVALDQHVASAAGWMAALLGSVVLLGVTGDLEVAMLLAVAVAPAAGLLVHAVGLAGSRGGRLATASGGTRTISSSSA